MDQKKTILVVDNMMQIRNILGFSLLKRGYNVHFAKNGKEALKYVFGENPVDLIILDVMMPELDGYEVIKQLKYSDDTKHIPVIFLTAKARKEDVSRGIEVGCDAYVIKPFKLSDLLCKIKKLIDQKDEKVLDEGSYWKNYIPNDLNQIYKYIEPCSEPLSH